MDREGERTRYIVGLGNPGRRYARTRHNVGWMALDVLRRRWGTGEGRSGFGGILCEGTIAGPDCATQKVVLFEPQLYMNRSGEAVKGLVSFYKLAPGDLLIVLDDMALETGRIRARPSGSPGGHNGLKDILRLLGTDEVPRLRIGIGAPPPEMDSVGYVLGRFTEAEMEIIGPATERTAEAVEDWVRRDISYVMETYNRKSDPGEAAEENSDE